MEYTKEEVLQFTINILGKIDVPGAYVKTIGVPIMNAIDNLFVLKQMLEVEKESRKPQDEAEMDAVGGDEDGRETDAE